MIEVIIDKEFKSLIYPLTESEKNQLENSLIEEGCRDALVIWNELLLDGHNRFDICQKHGIEFKTVEFEFEDRAAAKLWLIKNQFSRRNLAPYQRAELALRLKPLISDTAKKRKLAGKKINLDQNSDQGRTYEKLAEIAGISHDTIWKVERIEKEADEETKEELRKGEKAISSVFNRLKLKSVLSSKSSEWNTPQKIIDRVLKLFGEIDLDPCSDSKKELREAPNIPAKNYFTKEDDGLSKEWPGKIYMNPPYGNEIKSWIEHLCEQYEKSITTEAIALAPSRTDTEWFRAMKEYLRCFLWGRLQFANSEYPAPFPSMVVYLGNNEQKFINIFSDIGDVYRAI